MGAIRWEGNTFYLFDQTKFPVTEVWFPYIDYRPVADVVHAMVVWDTPAIGVAVAYAYCLAALVGEGLDEARETLAVSRPTAINLFWILKCMEHKAKGCGGAAEPLIVEARAIYAENMVMYRAMGAHGTVAAPEYARILTHRSTGVLTTGGYGTTLGVICATHGTDKVNMVYCDETQPFLRGAHLTAYELASDRTPTTLITGNMAANLTARGKIDLTVVGCDCMATNGDFANKIGTYSVTVNAHYHGIPFYMALPCSIINLSLADRSGTPIEKWNRDEARTLYGARTAPESAEVCNLTFDVTPRNLVTGIITEKGVIYPSFQESLQKLSG